MNLETLKTSTKESREYNNLRQYPLAIRKFRQDPSMKFDSPYAYRPSDSFLQSFFITKYPISDRDFGGPNSNFCNIFLNLLNQPEVDQLIEDKIESKEWIYHPVRSFEKWNTLSKMYYNDESYFWMILLFNRITDPFRSLQDLSIVRIPNFDFLQQLPTNLNITFDYAE